MSADIFDLIVVLTLAAYTLSGFWSGFILQFARLFSLIGAFWAMRSWTGMLAPQLQFISDPSWRTIAAGVIIFVGVMIAIGIVARLLKKLVAFSFGGWIDKICGAILGFIVGVLFWTVIIIILQKLFPNIEFLRNSRVLPWFEIVIAQLQQWLPPELGQYL